MHDQIYEYRRSFLWKIHSLGLGLALFWAGLGFMSLSDLSIDRNYIYPAGVLFAFAAFFVWGTRRMHHWHLPISVSDDGITTWSFGRRHDSVAWKDVKSIEKIHYFEDAFASNCTLFRIYGTRSTIRFDDRLKELGDALNAINAYVRKYKIPIVFYEREKVAFEQILAITTDPAERKKMLREGVETHPLEL